MNPILTLGQKDFRLLLLDRTSIIVTFMLPVVLIALIGAVFASVFRVEGVTSYDYAFSKVMFWGLIGGAASSVASIANEKNSNTMVRLQLSPASKWHVLLGKNFACLSVLLLSSFISWLFATIVFDVKTTSYAGLALVMIANGIFFAGLMSFLSNFVSTERAAGGLSWSVLQVLACFSGIMFPVTIMPPWMVKMTNFNPLMWGVRGMEMALWKEVPFSEMLLPLGIPVLSGAVLFSISVVMFRWNSDK